MTADAAVDLRLLPRSATIDDVGRLSLGGCDVEELADVFGTPLYVYCEAELRARCREYLAAFGADAVSYAGKAFLCVAMAQLADEEGMHLDVATGGELHVALRAGFPAARIVFHGNNKSAVELRTGLEVGVGRIVVDSFDEIDRIEALVAEGLPAPRVLVRLTPGVEAHTHEYIATGADDSKFGFTVSNGTAREAALRVAKSDAMDLAGFHCHIGSQILLLDSFAVAAAVVVDLAAEVTRQTGTAIEEINLGGGLGVPYTERGSRRAADPRLRLVRPRPVHARVCRRRPRSRTAAHGRGGSLDRRTVGDHALLRRHHQGDPGRPHLRRGRRRDE